MITEREIKNACTNQNVECNLHSSVSVCPNELTLIYILHKKGFKYLIRLNKSNLFCMCDTDFIESRYESFEKWLIEQCKIINDKLEDKNETKD